MNKDAVLRKSITITPPLFLKGGGGGVLRPFEKILDPSLYIYLLQKNIKCIDLSEYLNGFGKMFYHFNLC